MTAPSFRNPLALLMPPGPRSTDQQIWMVTFTDLVGLLLAFFVMMFAMSTLDQAQFQESYGGADSNRPLLPGALEETVRADRNAPRATVELGHDLGYLGTLLREQIAREALLAGTIVRQDGSQIILSLPAQLLFAPNGAEPTAQGGQALFALVGLLRNLQNRIEVEGHADPKPPTVAAFVSNWELSLARATAVALSLEAAGYGQSVVIRGRAAARYAEIAETLAPAERDALARRVDIIVHEEGN